MSGARRLPRPDDIGTILTSARSPAIMGEGTVRFRHAVRVLALLDGIAAIVGGVHQFARKARRHRVLAARTGGGDQPADGERLGTLQPHLDRHLIGGAADAAAADLDARLHIVERVVEDADRVALGARLDRVEGAVDDPFRDRLLAVEHDAVHEFGEDHVPKTGIGQDFALLGATTTGHTALPFSSAGSGTRPGLTAAIISGAWRRIWNGTGDDP